GGAVLDGTQLRDGTDSIFPRPDIQILEAAPAGPGSASQQAPLVAEVLFEAERDGFRRGQRNLGAFGSGGEAEEGVVRQRRIALQGKLRFRTISEADMGGFHWLEQ